MLKVSIVIVTYNSSNVIEENITSLYKFVKGIDFEIIVVDNNSKDDTLLKVQNISPEIIVIANKDNRGFAYANNQAFKVAHGNLVLILNPDIIFTEQTNLLGLAQKLMDNPSIGILAPRLFYASGVVQESARGFPTPLAQIVRGLKLERTFGGFSFYQKFVIAVDEIKTDLTVDWVIGAFMLIKKDVLKKVNYLDERYFMYYEDTDLCLTVKKSGFKVVYTPVFSGIHKYQRESSKSFFSKTRQYHLKSIFKFYFKNLFYLISR
jgi:hypothetical protein